VPATTVPAIVEQLVTAPAPTAAPSSTEPQLDLIAPWPDGAAVPDRNTCAGEDVSPALTWTDVPDGTIELAVTVTDLDAAYVHWIVYGIDPTRSGLVEGEVPAGAFQWVNSSGGAAYVGPCPPAGEQHQYLFTVHALNQQLEVADDASDSEVIESLNRIAIDQASVTGVFASGS
jgi:Raf kinase inhibitor-like YbhB/YbcL family protein